MLRENLQHVAEPSWRDLVHGTRGPLRGTGCKTPWLADTAGRSRLLPFIGPSSRRGCWHRVIRSKVRADGGKDVLEALVPVVSLLVEGSLAKRRGHRDGDLFGRQVAGHGPIAAEERVLQDPVTTDGDAQPVTVRLVEGMAGRTPGNRRAEPEQLRCDLLLVGFGREQRPLTDRFRRRGHVDDVGGL